MGCLRENESWARGERHFRYELRIAAVKSFCLYDPFRLEAHEVVHLEWTKIRNSLSRICCRALQPGCSAAAPRSTAPALGESPPRFGYATLGANRLATRAGAARPVRWKRAPAGTRWRQGRRQRVRRRDTSAGDSRAAAARLTQLQGISGPRCPHLAAGAGARGASFLSAASPRHHRVAVLETPGRVLLLGQRERSNPAVSRGGGFPTQAEHTEQIPGGSRGEKGPRTLPTGTTCDQPQNAG